jgi:hypothetical protein
MPHKPMLEQRIAKVLSMTLNCSPTLARGGPRLLVPHLSLTFLCAMNKRTVVTSYMLFLACSDIRWLSRFSIIYVVLKRPEKDLAVFFGSESPLLGALCIPICHGVRGAERGGEGLGGWALCKLPSRQSRLLKSLMFLIDCQRNNFQDRYVLYKLPEALRPLVPMSILSP